MALDTAEWLVWLGIKQPQVSLNEIRNDIEVLKEEIGTFSDFQTLVDNAADYPALQTDLENAGMPAAQAGAFIEKIQQAFTDFSSFETQTLALSSYLEFQSQFDSQSGLTGNRLTDQGEPAAGIRVHDNPGVSYSGVSVPAGTTEIYGNRIEFSEQALASVAPSAVGYANFTSDDPDDVVVFGKDITFSADVQNPNGFGVSVNVPFKEDGAVRSSRTLRLAANASQSVAFTVSYSTSQCHDYTIGNSGTILACWVPAGLTPP